MSTVKKREGQLINSVKYIFCVFVKIGIYYLFKTHTNKYVTIAANLSTAPHKVAYCQ
jgi:hypothetical protein